MRNRKAGMIVVNPSDREKLLVGTLLSGAVATPSLAALHAGLSALHNAYEENHVEKGDNRIIAESVLAGTGGGIGAMATRGILNNKTAQRLGNRALEEMSPLERRILKRITPYSLGAAVSGLGAGIGGVGVANVISGNANLMGLPGFSKKNFATPEEDLKPADIAGLRRMLADYNSGLEQPIVDKL